MTDDELTGRIRRSAKGDTAAFGEIIRHFESPLRSWAVAHCPPGVDSDDVAQKSFVTAFQRLADFESGTSFKAWLFAIARYQMMTDATQRRRIADYHSRYAPELLDRELERRSEIELPELMAVRVEALRQCLAELGGRGRELLAWRYDDRLPLKAIAARTGRSVGALKKNYFLLRQKLHACITAKIEPEGEVT